MLNVQHISRRVGLYFTQNTPFSQNIKYSFTMEIQVLFEHDK